MVILVLRSRAAATAVFPYTTECSPCRITWPHRENITQNDELASPCSELTPPGGRTGGGVCEGPCLGHQGLKLNPPVRVKNVTQTANERLRGY